MAWLNKLKLFEIDEPEAPTASEPEAVEEEQEPQVDAEANIQSTANIISEIYAQNNLSDKTNSIFTVQALINTLPQEMPTTAKQSTVSGILAVSGTKVQDLTVDAERRRNVLGAAKDKVVREQEALIDEAKADIESLKQAIASANVAIKNAEDIIAATEREVRNETKVINELIEFCEGVGGTK